MSIAAFDGPRTRGNQPPHSREHRKRIKGASVGACASLEQAADPGLPASKVAARALRHASRIYDQLGRSRIGPLPPNRFGEAVLVAASDGRADA